MRRRGDDHEDEEDEEDDGEEDDPDWEVLQHLQPDQRVLVNTLHGEDREDALDQLRITLFETQGIMFGQDPPPPPPPPAAGEGGDDEEGNEQEDEGEDNDENEDPIPGLAQAGHAGDADELEDADDAEGGMGGDALDDGDVFIDEDAIEGGLFADDQFDDEVPNDPDHEGVFVDDMYGPLNSFDADHPIWSFEGAGDTNSDDDRESDVPNLGSDSGEQLQDRLEMDVAANDDGTGLAVPPAHLPVPPAPPLNDAWNQFVQELQNDGYNLPHPLQPNPISAGLFAARSNASNASNAGSDAQARLDNDFGVAPREPASGSSQGSPATAEGTASPATPMALDEVAEAEKKTVWGPPGGWPDEDDEL
jgi:hypothetical protein